MHMNKYQVMIVDYLDTEIIFSREIFARSEVEAGFIFGTQITQQLTDHFVTTAHRHMIEIKRIHYDKVIRMAKVLI